MNLRYKIITIVYSTLILSGQLWATTNIPEVDEVKDNKNMRLPNMAEMKQQSEERDREDEIFFNSIKEKIRENQPDLTPCKIIGMVMERGLDQLSTRINQDIYHDTIAAINKEISKTQDPEAYKNQKKYHDTIAAINKEISKTQDPKARKNQKRYYNTIVALNKEILKTQDPEAQEDLKKTYASYENSKEVTTESIERFSILMNQRGINRERIKFLKDQQQKIETDLEKMEEQKRDYLQYREKHPEISPIDAESIIESKDSIIKMSQSHYKKNQLSLDKIVNKTDDEIINERIELDAKLKKTMAKLKL
ncbi:MAG: hypothetical protein ACRYGR_03890 [Janthinobacterium lividum]